MTKGETRDHEVSKALLSTALLSVDDLSQNESGMLPFAQGLQAAATKEVVERLLDKPDPFTVFVR